MAKKVLGKRYVTLALMIAMGCQTFTTVMAAESTNDHTKNRFTAGNPVDIFTPILDNGAAGDHIHGSSVVRLPNGEMLAVWFQGNGERDATTTKIMGSRLPVGEDQWTEPFVVTDAPGIADINPAVYVDREGKLWMFWYPVLGAIWESSQPRFAYAEPGNYEYEKIGNKAPVWKWSDTIPIKIGKNIGGVVNPETDEFVVDIKNGYEELAQYLFSPIYIPGDNDDITQIYEDLNSGSGVNAFIREDDFRELALQILMKSGGVSEKQLFTPTVADKIYPINGEVQRSGYPLMRRIGWQTKDKPLEIIVSKGTMLSTGKIGEGTERRMIVPLYSDGLEMTIMAITDDGGKTWIMSKPIIGVANIQASMLQRENGDIVAYMRDNGPPPSRVQYAISRDDGYTWSIGKDRRDLFDYGVGHDMAKLPNGHWVFVSNGNQNGRYTLSVALSDDEGKTWKYRRHIEVDTRETAGSYHYPAVMIDDAGNIHITYTVDYTDADTNKDGASLKNHNNIKYIRVDEEWIKMGDWSNENRGYEAIFSYETRDIDITLPIDFDATKEVDGKFKISEIEKVIALLPTSVKGYLTYNNNGQNGLEMAAPEYVEIPVVIDKTIFRDLFIEEEMTIKDNKIKFIIDLEKLPEGITGDMLPKRAPTLYRVAIHK